MPVTWLHVSDFHIREGDPYDRNVVLKALVSSVRRMRHRSGAMLVSGEVAFHFGSAGTFRAAAGERHHACG